jgi:L-gulonolactone oxidase
LINVGSISDQTLAGVISTASHGSGINYGVMSTHVISLTLLLANGSRVSCSRQQSPDIFIASLCGLGCTGIILSIKFQVEPAFRLKEIQETVGFDYGIENLDVLVSAAEHVRLWWFPADASIRASYADRTYEVRALNFWPTSDLMSLSRSPRSSPTALLGFLCLDTT